MRHSRIKYCKSNESISFEKMIFSPRGKCAFFALKIISIFLILLLTFISWTFIKEDEGIPSPVLLQFFPINYTTEFIFCKPSKSRAVFEDR